MRIFIDCTDTHFSRSNSGIQRVVRNVVAHARAAGGAAGSECIPVVYQGGRFWPVDTPSATSIGTAPRAVRNRLDEQYFRVAHAIARRLPLPWLQRFLLAHRRDFGLARFLYAPVALWKWLRQGLRPKRPPADIAAGDILYLPDASWFTNYLDEVARLRAGGTRIALLLYDVIPLTHPEFCHPSHLTWFRSWFDRIQTLTDVLLGISRFTLATFDHHRSPGLSPPPAAVAYLGHDLPKSASGAVRHAGLRAALEGPDPVFLCVGTIDARKNQATLLDAFDALWNAGHRLRLILLGSAGWRSEDVLPRTRSHPAFGRQLFWFDDVDDHDLVLSYARARALVFPSLAEGFGLPIVEALSQGIPVVASDIEVFREIAGDHIGYFDPRDSADIARSVLECCEKRPGRAAAEPFRWLSWEDSTREMIRALLRLCPPAK